MVVLQLTFRLILLVCLSRAENGVKKSGPYNVVIEKVTECDDDGTGTVVWGTKIQRTSDGRYTYSGPVYLGNSVDQDFWISIELQSFSNGGYRPRYIHHTFKGCEEIWKYFKGPFQGFFQSAGFKIDNCPIPAGNYTGKDFDVNVHHVNNVKEMVYNRYKAVFLFYYKQKKAGCINIYLEFVPK